MSRIVCTALTEKYRDPLVPSPLNTTMTTNTTATLLAAAALLSASALATPGNGNGNGNANNDPHRPTGTLDVVKKWVRSGTRVQLDWNIEYPKSVADLIDRDVNGEVRTKEEVLMTVRIAGVAFGNGIQELPVALSTKIGDGSWNELFYGTGSEVNASEYVFEQIVPAGTTINFGGRAKDSNGDWLDFRSTGNSDPTIVGLKNGDEPPYYAPAYQQDDIESFLSGYLWKGKSNNGHGNNLDGVDVSNPGQGAGGPNGEVDPSGLEDDEAKNVMKLNPRDMIYLWELASRDTGEWWYDQQDLVVVVSYSTVITSDTW